MKKINLKIALLIVIFIIALYGGASWYFSTVFVASPVKLITPKEITEAQKTLEPKGIPLPEIVEIEGFDSVTLAGYFYDNPQDAGCGIVILHGYSSIAYDMTGYVPMFWELGCKVVAYDARGHGNSSFAYHTFGYYERQDASAVIDWLTRETGIQPEHIGLLGLSYGAATSLQTLAERSDLAFVVADSPYQDCYTIVAYQGQQHFGSWLQLLMSGAIALAEWRADFDIDEVSPQEVIKNAHTPVLLIHALEDDITFASHSETIYANADKANTVLEITDWGNGHGRSRGTNPAAYEELVYNFIDNYAPQFRKAISD